MIKYQDSLENVKLVELTGFFEGWKNKPSNQRFYDILAKSSYIELAIDTSRENTIAGFITAISDGIFSAYIPLLEIRLEYRNHGIGKELVSRILRKLENVYMIDLVCDDNLIEYYTKLGFAKTQGMSIRHYDKIK